MAKQLFIKPELCRGCRSCELICSFNKQNRFSPSGSAVTVYEFEGSASIVPMMCMQCEDPACVKACTVGAIRKDIDGIVKINWDKCIGCKMCMIACPLGNIHLDKSQKKMIKCDLCGGDPKCVKCCPFGAIVYEDPNDIDRNASLANKINTIYGEGAK